MTETEYNLAQRWFTEVWNDGRREAIAEMLTPDGVIHDGGADSVGPEGFYPFFDRIRGATSNLRIRIEDTFTQRDRICVRWTCAAKHTGDGFGMPPTGKMISITGITIVRVANGMLVEAWQNWDMLGMMEQINGSAKSPTYIG